MTAADVIIRGPRGKVAMLGGPAGIISVVVGHASLPRCRAKLRRQEENEQAARVNPPGFRGDAMASAMNRAVAVGVLEGVVGAARIELATPAV